MHYNAAFALSTIVSADSQAGTRTISDLSGHHSNMHSITTQRRASVRVDLKMVPNIVGWSSNLHMGKPGCEPLALTLIATD
jgi:hypothetical protein